MQRHELLQIAVLGLERHTLPAELRNAALAADDDAAALLRALARSHFSEKAAGALPAAPGLLPAPDCGAHNPCGFLSARHLEQILNGPYAPALEEYLDALAAASRHLPPAALPALLDMALKDERLAGKIIPLAGSRGAWLAQQVERWRPLFFPPDPGGWALASLDERVRILKHLRVANSQEALRLLQSTWPSDGSLERARLLPVLEKGLTAADAPFLESCMDDKRKEVRQSAARLLAILPGSALAARLRQYAESCFRFPGRDKWEVHVPDQAPAAWQRDGIEVPVGGKGGAKAAVLRQLFQKIDPDQWEEVFSLRPSEILRLYGKSDWSAAILEGLSGAVVLFSRDRWADALALYWNERQADADVLPAAGPAGLVSPAVMERITKDHLSANGGIIAERSLAWVLLQHSHMPWPEEMVRQIIAGFGARLSTHAAQNWSMWHYRELFRRAAFRCPVALMPELEKAWPVDSRAWYQWEKEVGFFLRALAFRREMQEALNGSSV